MPDDFALPEKLSKQLLILEKDNLVARPWGGQGLQAFKGLPGTADPDGVPYGESFEISAFDDDAEASRFPSYLVTADGTRVSLPRLLEEHGEELLGPAFVRRYGACFPLLPKILSVAELLSVQGHPAGNTEVYIIIAADPGATLRLGFCRDIDARQTAEDLKRGLSIQQDLAATLADWLDESQLQTLVKTWFAARDASESMIHDVLAEHGVPAEITAHSLELLGELKQIYWNMLDSMNAIEVHAGQVIYNATPGRLLAATDGIAAAEVHALGNPEGREVLALEVRRPGPTFRAWDNVRFPRREVDVDAALAALNLRATRAQEFIAEPQAVPGREGVLVSVDCEFFRVEHLRPGVDRHVAVESSSPHSLHCIAGSVCVLDRNGTSIGELSQGQSALVPVGVEAYRVVADGDAEVIRVTLPEKS